MKYLFLLFIGLVLYWNTVGYYNSPWWLIQRERTLARDHYTCQLCGSHRKLNVHHAKYRMKSKLDKDCIVLCKYCHAKQHKINDKYILRS